MPIIAAESSTTNDQGGNILMGNEKVGGEVLLGFFYGKCLMHKCPMGASSPYGGEENDKREKGGRGEENHSIT